MLPPRKQASVRDGGQYLIFNRLIRVPARCSFTLLSYHQCINQLGIRRFCYYTTGYSANECLGSSVRPLQQGVRPRSATLRFQFYVLRFTFHTAFISAGSIIYILLFKRSAVLSLFLGGVRHVLYKRVRAVSLLFYRTHSSFTARTVLCFMLYTALSPV